MHNVPLNKTIRELLADHNIKPKFGDGSYDLNRVERIIFSRGLRVSEWTQHLARDGRVMIIGSLGYMSYAHSPVHEFSVGSYCSIAGGVTTMGMHHPYNRVSTHPISYGAFYADAAKKMGVSKNEAFSSFDGRPKPLRVGSDVWIARNATLSGGISLGTGSVVATGAIVTKDVPPYAIVAGVPAKVVKFRFPEDLVERLTATRWWEAPLPVLARFNFSDPTRFCAEWEKSAPTQTHRPREITADDILALCK